MCVRFVNHSMITERIGRHDVLLPINHNHYNYRKTKSFTKSFQSLYGGQFKLSTQLIKPNCLGVKQSPKEKSRQSEVVFRFRLPVSSSPFPKKWKQLETFVLKWSNPLFSPSQSQLLHAFFSGLTSRNLKTHRWTHTDWTPVTALAGDVLSPLSEIELACRNEASKVD